MINLNVSFWSQIWLRSCLFPLLYFLAALYEWSPTVSSWAPPLILYMGTRVNKALFLTTHRAVIMQLLTSRFTTHMYLSFYSANVCNLQNAALRQILWYFIKVFHSLLPGTALKQKLMMTASFHNQIHITHMLVNPRAQLLSIQEKMQTIISIKL